MRVYKASKKGERRYLLFLSVVYPPHYLHNLSSETATATPLVSIGNTDIMTFEPSASTDHSQENPSSAETSEDEAGSITSQVDGPGKGATFVPKGYNRYKNYRKEFMKEWVGCDTQDCEAYKTLVDKYGK